MPVIVEEEYSTTSHVAVAIGVDEELGLLFVQDPMTHVTSERLISAERHLGALYRNAAIVAFRPEESAIVEKLDEADVRDTEHLRLVDRRELVNDLHLNDHLSLYQQVDTVSPLQMDLFVDQRKGPLPFDVQSELP